MPNSRRSLYRWSEGALRRVGTISDAHLHAWEYELVLSGTWRTADEDAVRLWRTRRPDLAPEELWVGEGERPAEAEG